MTTKRQKRCDHCKDFYIYIGSGDGRHNPENDPNLCTTCKTAVNKVLSNIQCKFECRYRNVNELEKFSDVTLEQLLKLEMQIPAGYGQRFWPGLYDLKTGDSNFIREIKPRDGKYYNVPFRLSTWKINPEFIIEVPMEFDLIKNDWTGNLW